MSYVVNAAGKRGPGQLRVAVNLTLGCVLLGGCSSGSERFSTFSFGSGYEAGAAPTARASSPGTPMAANSALPSRVQPAANYQAAAQSGYQTASAHSETTGGYIQVSRVDLPPLQQRDPGAQRTRTADGYGPYNRPPVADGVYTGPRVYTPYDQPQDGAPPPPPAYRSGDDAPRYDNREPPPPAPGFYRRSGDGVPPYDGRGGAQVYEPKPERDYSDAPPRGDYPRDYPRGPVASNRGDSQVVRVAPGDTLYSLARRYGVTVDMIARANGLSSIHVRPGTEILIPRADPTSYGQARTNAPAPQVAACSGERCHQVKPGETLVSIARAYGVTERRIAEANNLASARSLRAGQTISIPGSGQAPRQAVASANPENRDRPTAPQGGKAPAPAVAVPQGNGERVGTLKAPQPLRPAPEVSTAAAQPAPELTCEAALSNPLPRMGSTFRKPVEGKTIAQFGPQRDGTVNEGITISVPKGTPVKAAENGVVAYVGDELPGFGNLILIRHADEYVTAYAHADTILVKKCDVVKRGQPVATAGATGDASQPQLHFEIRKNSKPVDPSPLMGS
jgi:murein DD-endopeptidase MepM/ murein hydrolase activator NlpD